MILNEAKKKVKISKIRDKKQREKIEEKTLNVLRKQTKKDNSEYLILKVILSIAIMIEIIINRNILVENRALKETKEIKMCN